MQAGDWVRTENGDLIELTEEMEDIGMFLYSCKSFMVKRGMFWYEEPSTEFEIKYLLENNMPLFEGGWFVIPRGGDRHQEGEKIVEWFESPIECLREGDVFEYSEEKWHYHNATDIPNPKYVSRIWTEDKEGNLLLRWKKTYQEL